MDEKLRLWCRGLRPNGLIVVKAVTMETLNQSVDNLKSSNFNVQVTLINIARSQDILNLTRLEALNPVFVITAWQEKEK